MFAGESSAAGLAGKATWLYVSIHYHFSRRCAWCCIVWMERMENIVSSVETEVAMYSMV